MERALFRICLIQAGLLFGFLGLFYTDLPSQVPSHFGWDGRADALGPKGFLWLLPVTYLMAIQIAAVARKNPSVIRLPFSVARDQLPQAVGLTLTFLSGALAGLGALLSYLTWVVVNQPSLEAQVGWALVPVAIGLSLLGAGGYLWKLRSLRRLAWTS